MESTSLSFVESFVFAGLGNVVCQQADEPPE
jgi:hypothetical protein